MRHTTVSAGLIPIHEGENVLTVAAWEVGFLLDQILLEKSNAQVALISGSKEPEGADSDIVYRLRTTHGLNVNITGDEDIDNADPPRRSSYTKEVLESEQIKLLIISASVDSSNILDEYLDVNVPILVLEQELVDDMQIANEGGSFDELREWSITDNTHPITDGLSTGNVTVQESPNPGLPGQLLYVTEPLADGAVTLAVSPDDPAQIAIATFDAGTSLLDGSTASNRRAFIGLGNWNLGADVATNEIWGIFDATIKWLVGEDTSVENWDLY